MSSVPGTFRLPEGTRVSIEPHAREGPKGSYLTLQLGIGLTEWTIEWCKATERQLAAETERE